MISFDHTGQPAHVRSTFNESLTRAAQVIDPQVDSVTHALFTLAGALAPANAERMTLSEATNFLLQNSDQLLALTP